MHPTWRTVPALYFLFKRRHHLRHRPLQQVQVKPNVVVIQRLQKRRRHNASRFWAWFPLPVYEAPRLLRLQQNAGFFQKPVPSEIEPAFGGGDNPGTGFLRDILRSKPCFMKQFRARRPGIVVLGFWAPTGPKCPRFSRRMPIGGPAEKVAFGWKISNNQAQIRRWAGIAQW